MSLLFPTCPWVQLLDATQINRYVQLVGHEQGEWKRALSLQFTVIGMARPYACSALSGSSFGFTGLVGSCSCGVSAAVWPGLVWKKLSTILNVVGNVVSSGGALWPCPEKLSFCPSFKTGSSLVETVLQVKCFPGPASVLPAGMHSNSSRVHIWIQMLLSQLPDKFRSSPKFTFLHQQ